MLYPGAPTGTSNMDGGGLQWDATVEGTQNFADFSDHGDMPQDAEDYGVYNLDSHMVDDCPPHSHQQQQQQKWMAMGPVAAAGSVLMERTTASRSTAGSSISSSGGGKARTLHATAPALSVSSSSSGHKSRAKMHTDLSHGTLAAFSAGSYGMGGVDAYAANGALASGGAMAPYYYTDAAAAALSSHGILDMQQHYLSLYGAQDLPAVPFAADALHYGGAGSHPHPHQQPQQHVNPSCTQMNVDDFVPVAISPHTYGSASSQRSSPDLGGEDVWSLPVAASPAESHDSTTSSFGHHQQQHQQQFGSDHDSLVKTAPEEDLTSSTATATAAYHPQRSGSEGSEVTPARDHHLYKQPVCGEDGLYHCPWEGDANCNHKPEKLKCNYDKSVDSHLKPYRCKHHSCENARFSSTACLLRHEREAHAMHGHGDKPYLCPHPGCDRAQPGNGFPRQWNLKDHMRRVHRDDGPSLPPSSSYSSAMATATAGTARGSLSASSNTGKNTNNNGSSSRSSSSGSQTVAKERKRKKERMSGDGAGTATASSSRKSSSSSSSSKRSSARNQADAAAATAAAAAAAAAAAESHRLDAQQAMEAAKRASLERACNEWYGHKQALSDIVMGFTQPDDPQILQQLQDAQMHFSAIAQVSTDMLSSQKAGGVQASAYQFDAFPQQSG